MADDAISTARDAVQYALALHDEERLAHARMELAHQLRAAGGNVEAAEEFEQAADAFERAGRVALRAQALANAGVALSHARQAREGMLLSRQASQLFEDVGDAAARSRVEGNIAVMHRELGELELGLAAAQRAELAAGPRPDLAQQCALVGLQAELALDLGRGELARERAEQALRLARQVGEANLVGRQLDLLATVLMRAAGPSACLPVCFEAFGHYRRLGDEEAVYRTTVQLALVYQLLGRWPDALGALSDARGLAVRLGHTDELARLQAGVAATQVALGRFGEAAVEARAAVAAYRAVGDVAGLGRALVTLGQCADGVGDRDGARRLWAEAQSLLDGTDRDGAEAVAQLLGS